MDMKKIVNDERLGRAILLEEELKQYDEREKV